MLSGGGRVCPPMAHFVALFGEAQAARPGPRQLARSWSTIQETCPHAIFNALTCVTLCDLSKFDRHQKPIAHEAASVLSEVHHK